MFLSIIIPAYQSEKTLPRLLDSISKEKIKGMEVIVVEDGGNKKLETSNLEPETAFKNYKLQIINSLKIANYKLKINKGPAFARNFGAKKARGDVLLFLDSDVVVLPGTIKEVEKIFKEDKYKVAATGVWDKKQLSHKFFPKFKALRDWSYWINEKKADSYYYLFSTRIAAIRRDVFLKEKGFNENYRGADVEDIEFTYRLAKKYRIDFNEKMRVHHEFEDFWPVAKKYFKRAYQWIGIYQSRKKFDPVATTGSEAVTTVSAVGLVIMLIVFVVYGVVLRIMNQELRIFNFSQFNYLILTSFFLILLLHLWGVRKFLKFVYKQEGFWFAVKSFFIGILLYQFIFAGSLAGLVKGRVFPRAPERRLFREHHQKNRV